jgi:hypothetical protein
MRIAISVIAATLLLGACHEETDQHTTYQQPTTPAPVEPATAPGAVAAPPSADDRRAAAGAVLDLLAKHILAGQLDYHFNASGEGVCLGTAGLAFIGSGSTLARGPYKAALVRVHERIRQIMDTRDFPLQPSWGCAQSTIFLAELHRTAPPEQREAISALLAKYVDMLVKAQTVRGSWCHTFEDIKNSLNYDDLMAVSVMAMQGLGMSRREGITIDQQVFAKGLAYIANSSDASSGHIGYSPRDGQRGMAGPGRAGGGLLALEACGQEHTPLAKAAANYLIQSFPGTELNSGHASAQLSESWAAWWAAESGNYTRFWEGQGAVIMARRKADGGFHCAPSDGKAGDPPAEMGDFANAMHALMLIAPEGFIFAGEAKDSPRAALEDAATLLEAWGSSAPDCLKAFVALKNRASFPSDAEIAKQLATTIRGLAKAAQERSSSAIMTLLGASLTMDAVFNAKTRHITADVGLAAVRLGGLAKVKIHVLPNAELMISPPPDHALIPSAAAQRIVISIGTKQGQAPDATLATEVTWELAGLTFTSTVPVTITKSPAQL